MCTVTYLPLSKSSFILTHNRDEHYTRSIATLPEKRMVHGEEIVYPKDEQGGGTWFAAGKEFTLCLLNGGFQKHIQTPPYRHSRGLVIPDFFSYAHVERFVEEYNFKDLEPFTMIILQHDTQQVHQVVKDVDELHYSVKDNSIHHISSSTTLYTPEEREKRRVWFEQWNKDHPSYSQQDIIDFQMSPHDETGNEGIRINRDAILSTVSLTSVLKNEKNEISMFYEDLLQHKKREIDI